MTIGDIDPKYHAQQWTQHFSDLRQHGSLTFESQHRAKDGRLIPVEIVSNYFLFGAEERICVFARDIAVRKAAEDQIKHWAFYDPLTLLANRRLLIDRMQLAMAASVRNGRWGALLFVDLDNFKTLNDTRGHDVGDLLLLQVAQRLGACVRECDTVARLGGDEFVVVLPNLSEDVREAATQASIAGTKVLASLDQAFQLAGQQHKSTASIGATLFINQETTVDELIKQADIAMYKAKAAGRNALRFHQLHADVSLGSRTKISVSDILKTI